MLKEMHLNKELVYIELEHGKYYALSNSLDLKYFLAFNNCYRIELHKTNSESIKQMLHVILR